MRRMQKTWAGLACFTLAVVLAAPSPVGGQTTTQERPARPFDENDISFDDEDPPKADAPAAEKPREEKPAGSAKPTTRATAKKPSVFRLATIAMDGPLPEGSNPQDLFTEGTKGTLLDFIRRLDTARGDDDIDAVLLEIRNPAIGRGTLHEIRQAIGRLRAGGKRVYASLHSASPADYLIASACDVIVMPESGDLILPGLRAEIMFYNRLFRKLGIEADMLQVGDFKGAAEPYTRDKMSDSFREQLSTVLDDLFEQMVDEIAESRGLPKHRVRESIDKGILTAQAAKEAGLIDIVAYDQDWRKELLNKHDREDLKVLENYGAKKVDTDFSGMSGFIRFMELLSGSKSRSKGSGKDKIAVVHAIGPIQTGESTSSLFGDQIMGSETIVEALQTAEDNDAVVAVVLRVNSPGGSALASDLIWNQIRQMKKPVVASMGDVAGSGGYYISMGCDKILAEPGTITGSIGVVGGKLVTGPMFERFGLTTDIVSRGKNSGLFSSSTPFSDSERDAWQGMMDEVYDQFTRKAAEGRKMDVEELKKYAGGRIWTGRQAKDIGLVDDVGTLDDAIRLATKMAGKNPDKRPELLILPETKSFFDQLFNSNSVSVPNVTLGTTETELLQEARSLQRFFAEPSVLLMPYRIEIK